MTQATGADEGPQGHAPLLGVPGPGRGLQLEMYLEGTDPGSAHCQYFILPPLDLHVTRVEHAAGDGLGSVFVYPSIRSAAAVDTIVGDPFPCDASSEEDAAQARILYGSQMQREQMTFPGGGAHPLKPEQVLLVRAAVRNRGGGPRAIPVHVNLWTAEVQAPTAYLFRFDPVPTPPLSAQHCQFPQSVSLLTVHADMGASGVALRAWTQDPDGARESLFEQVPWRALEIRALDPPRVLPAGAFGQIECEFAGGEPAPNDAASALEPNACVVYGSYTANAALPPEAETCRGPESGAGLLEAAPRG